LIQRDRSAHFAWEIGDDDLALIEKAEIGDEYAHLDAELENRKP
jgi:uncharacterized small protein (DUF1192 family)